ncbi:MAG: lysophospholipid acyltransferase family protein [Bdellovibrionaceae bacterium]|nr:lysophospholipid acyltransferase family protein [Pseudobdellovibrionaceae bacterium]
MRQIEILKHFLVFGQVLMDRLYQSYNEDLKFEIANEGPIYIQDVATSGRGWVFVGAHVGGWDISTLFLKKNPGTARLGMVHFIGQGFTFDNVLKRSEEKASKVDSIQSQSGEGSLLTVKTFLESNKHVGFLADRAVGSQIELVPFLGKLAPFETRPYKVAVACRAPMVFTYNLKTATHKYLFISSNHSELKYSPLKDRREEVYDWTEVFVRDLEKQVKRFPHQWFNFYSFWSSLPVGWKAEASKRTDHCLLEELSIPVAAKLAPVLGPNPSA